MDNKRLLNIFVIVFIDLLGFGLILPLLPFYVDQYGATPLVVGFLTAIYAAAPLGASLAEEEFLVVIPRRTLNLAVLELNAAQQVLEAYPEIEAWVIGGHSQGGAMTASYAGNHPQWIRD
jgi:pimeloyl-ACP methyl ester carboxylesterase